MPLDSWGGGTGSKRIKAEKKQPSKGTRGEFVLSVKCVIGNTEEFRSYRIHVNNREVRAPKGDGGLQNGAKKEKHGKLHRTLTAGSF